MIRRAVRVSAVRGKKGVFAHEMLDAVSHPKAIAKSLFFCTLCRPFPTGLKFFGGPGVMVNLGGNRCSCHKGQTENEENWEKQPAHSPIPFSRGLSSKLRGLLEFRSHPTQKPHLPSASHPYHSGRYRQESGQLHRFLCPQEHV